MTMVRFDAERRGVLSLLEVEVGAHRGLARAIGAALFDLRVQVVASRTCISAGRRVQRLEVVEFDGGPLDRRRRTQIESRLGQTLAKRRRARRPGPRFATGRPLRAAA